MQQHGSAAAAAILPPRAWLGLRCAPLEKESYSKAEAVAE
jgi:hypothetical protein